MVPRLCECCRQSQAGVVSNSLNKIHQAWGPPFSQALYTRRHAAALGQIFFNGIRKWKMDMPPGPAACRTDGRSTSAQKVRRERRRQRRSIMYFGCHQILSKSFLDRRPERVSKKGGDSYDVRTEWQLVGLQSPLPISMMIS